MGMAIALSLLRVMAEVWMAMRVLLVMARRMKPSAVVGTSMTNYALEQMLGKLQASV